MASAATFLFLIDRKKFCSRNVRLMWPRSYNSSKDYNYMTFLGCLQPAMLSRNVGAEKE